MEFNIIIRPYTKCLLTVERTEDDLKILVVSSMGKVLHDIQTPSKHKLSPFITNSKPWRLWGDIDRVVKTLGIHYQDNTATGTSLFSTDIEFEMLIEDVAKLEQLIKGFDR